MSGLISAQDRGLLFGDGVFDTLAVYQGQPQLFEAHLARLERHALAINIKVEANQLRAEILASIKKFSQRDCILRTTITRGVSARGLWPKETSAPTILCHASLFDRTLIGAPAKLIVSTIARNETSPTSRIKTLAYLDHVLAAGEANEAGADDAVFLNTQGALSCTTIGNIFVLENNLLLTPPLKDGVLDGTIRALLLEHPPQGFRVTEQTMSLDRALKADALFITNSLRLVRPVTQLSKLVFPPLPIHSALLSHVENMLASSAQSNRHNP